MICSVTLVLLSLVAAGSGCPNDGGEELKVPGRRYPCPAFVSRSEWNARRPKITTTITTPVTHMFILHTATPQCSSSTSCAARMRSIQNYHMDTKRWFDIAYSFMIGGDGKVYEGRGWGKEGGLTCCPYYNRISHSIAFVGNYTSALPSRDMLNVAKKLIECGVAKNKVSSEYSVAGQRDACNCVARTCPGDALYREISSWDRCHAINLPWDRCNDFPGYKFEK